MTSLVVWYLVYLLNNTSQVRYTGPYTYEQCMIKADEIDKQKPVYAYCTSAAK